ncbi:MAG: MATE family efflux transporter [Flammeovirgaceae bacterium]
MENEKYTTHFKKLFKLAYPVMLSQAGQILVGIADNMMVGQVGAIPLAASAFANAVFFNIMVLGMGIAYGVTPLVGAALGEKDNKKIGRILKNGIFINVLSGIVMLIIMFGITPFMHHMGQDPEVVEEAIPYFYTLAFSILPLMIFFNFKQFNEGVASTKPTMVITLSSNVINILLNYILIYGHWGFPELGLLGAGYATLISRILMGIALAIYTFKAAYFKPFIREMANTRIRLDECLKIYRLGIPIAGQMLMEVMVFAIGAIMIGSIGAIEQAAHQVVIGLAALTYMIANGLAAATTIRVSNQLGEGDWQNMRKAAHTGTLMALVFMTITAVIFVIFKYPLPDLFVKDEDREVVIIAAKLMIIAGFFQLFDGIQVVALGALRGLHDVKIPTFLTFIAYWVIGLPACYLLGFTFEMGVEGIWYGFLIALGTASILLGIRFEQSSKKVIHREAQLTNDATTTALELE